MARYLRNSQGRDHLRGHEPAAHADPGRLPARLPRGQATALSAAPRAGFRTPLGAQPPVTLPPDDREMIDLGWSDRHLKALAALFGTIAAPAYDGESERHARLAAAALAEVVEPSDLRQLRVLLNMFQCWSAHQLSTAPRPSRLCPWPSANGSCTPGPPAACHRDARSSIP